MHGLLLVLTQCILSDYTIPIKNIVYNFYTTDLVRDYFMQKNKNLDELIGAVEKKLEDAVNSVMRNTTSGVFIKFQRREITNLPARPEQLERCGQNMQDFAELLNDVFLNSNEYSSILMSNCGADDYTELFRSSDQKTPYVMHQVLPYCTTRTLIFNESEDEKFLSMYGTALLKASGVRDINPLMIEEVMNGDSGKDLVITITDEAMKELQEKGCFSLS